MSDPQATTVAGVDVGGTFTDAVVVGPDGTPVMRKAATTPSDQGEGLEAAVRDAWSAPLDALAHGTTTATNAVLERTFGRPVLVVTRGFADLLVIGRQDRPSLYDLTAVRPRPVVDRDHVVDVDERIGPHGRIVTALTDDEVDRVTAAVAALGADAVAIVLLFSWADDCHERLLADALRTVDPSLHVTVSADLVGAVREYERASTCALNAAVGPLMARYLSTLGDRAAALGVPQDRITVMTSGGGTASLDRMVAEPVHTLLSGPAAGVVAAAAAARQAGFADAVAFDMGGTSTDVCLIHEGRPVIAVDGAIDGLPIGTPTVGVHTVGAGGGSIAALDAGGALQVGPRSAGADPGPACYGLGGTQPTVTDAHAVLGHLRELAGGQVRPDADAAARAVATLEGVTAAGILDVVRAQMVRALRRVTTEAGVDPAELALVAYGGAGPLHASALSRALGCAAAVLPPAPGVLSAAGLLVAPRRQEVSQTVMAAPGDDLSEVCSALADRLAPDLRERTVALDVRYRGQAHELRLPWEDPGTTDDVVDSLAAAYGYSMPQAEVEIVTARVIGTGSPLHADDLTGWDLGPDRPAEEVLADLGEGVQTVTVHARGSLTRPDTVIDGPAIITQPDSTALLLADDVGTVDDAGNLVIRRVRDRDQATTEAGA